MKTVVRGPNLDPGLKASREVFDIAVAVGRKVGLYLTLCGEWLSRFGKTEKSGCTDAI